MKLTKAQKDAIERALTHHNNVRGKGMVAAVVWGIAYAGIDQSLNGVVVRQMQYGMDARYFQTSPDLATVRFLGRTIRVHPTPVCAMCGRKVYSAKQKAIYAGYEDDMLCTRCESRMQH